jgi:cytochrome c peroxidase
MTYPCPDQKRGTLSLFRRPLPATDLTFAQSIMWDGREPSLSSQATDATLGHAQATVPLPNGAMAAVVSLESALFTAQTSTISAGDLTAAGALGGPLALSTVPFAIGSNPGGGNPDVFTIFDAWTNAASAGRAQIARGQQIFNERTFQANGVGGAPSPSFAARCSTCHNAFNSGNDSIPEFLDIGTADGGANRLPDLPMYTLQNRTTRATIQTTDPGRAMVTGKWADIGEFKTPGLRGLAARPPYFHNGLAPNLDAVVDFYDQRFSIGFTAQEHADLVAFLGAL